MARSLSRCPPAAVRIFKEQLKTPGDVRPTLAEHLDSRAAEGTNGEDRSRSEPKIATPSTAVRLVAIPLWRPLCAAVRPSHTLLREIFDLPADLPPHAPFYSVGVKERM